MHYETRKANAYVMEGFTGEVALSWTLHRILKTNEGRAFQKNEKKRNSRNESKEAWEWTACLRKSHKVWFSHRQVLHVPVETYWEICTIFTQFLKFFKEFLLFDWFEKEREREREASICCSTYLYIHWLILICFLTRDETCNLGVLGQYSNQLSYLARTHSVFNHIFIQHFVNNWERITQHESSCPGRYGSVDWVPACEMKGHWFTSWSDHMPGLRARSPVGGGQEGANWCFSPSLSPSLPLPIKIINK